MRPEFLNRIDKTIVFHSLTQKDIYKIIDLQMLELSKRLQKHGLGIQLSTAAKQWLLDKGYDAKNGVRPMRRLIQDEIEDHVAAEMLAEQYQTGDIVSVGVKSGKLTYSTLHE
jgi:ATP-dependent Clp protease ATP-binding subunit ClpC